MHVFINNQQVNVTPQMLLGSGGEADVYNIGRGTALKIYKSPDHPDHLTPKDREAARRRIEEHQEKLLQFPNNLPPNVIVPEGLAYDTSNKIVGYVMRFVEGSDPLMRYSEKSFRQAGVSNDQVLQIFRKLYTIVVGIHNKKVTIGDFTDLNVLVKNGDPFLIDADSFQFAGYYCTVYTVNFVDPLLCDPDQSHLELNQPHNQNSDWYGFAVMLLRSFLYVGPYGGVYRPSNVSDRIPDVTRPLHQISIFHPGVRYPRPATPYTVLPDDLLDCFYKMFEEGKRGEFPSSLLEVMRWTKCLKCGMEHARAVCPGCAEAAPAAVKEKVMIRGKVTATRIFTTRGVIVFAAVQQDKLLWLYHENGDYKREDGTVVVTNPIDPHLRFRIQGNLTYIGKGQQVLTFSGGTSHGRMAVGSFGTLPVFDANTNHFYWLEQGSLLREDNVANMELLAGSDYVGDILINQTLFWVGERFGFGFYRAGGLQIAFIFNAEKRGINDNVKLPRIRGQLIDSTCCFASKRCWFITTTEEGGRRVNRCYVISCDGVVIAESVADQGDASWLGTLRGKLATGDFLLAATDDGLVRVEVQGSSIVETKQFPDTVPFMDAESHIFPSKGGVYVVSYDEVHLLSIK